MTLIIRKIAFVSFLALILCETIYGSAIPQSVLEPSKEESTDTDTTDNFSKKLASSKSSKSKEKVDKKYYVSPDKANWFKAFLYCVSAGLELATVESEAETDLLNEVLDKDDIKEGWKEGYWLSGNSLAYPETLEFYWASTGQKIIYTNWGKDQPDNAGKKEFCIGVGLVGKKPAWNDYAPETELKYICQSPRPCC
ncbi:C-type lectin 37Da-like isoform X2 [Sitophilus oryzae]|uniref:C-type lectin 37Da-like isoform X2 n=1 Tax=Sitophilus oryzae TaxID=7048 RepID=A0A6J2XBQ6_SITOR|nr:C-type lectin 37Da-like isoform X2 [Sitophilus oryzae]